MPWGAIVSAVGSLAASYMGLRSTERMSNTSYQRAMKDMREAGLNPILAYTQGGASTPSFNFPNPVADVPEHVATAKRVKFEGDVARAQEEALKAQADAARENALTNRMAVDVQKGQYNLDVGRTSVQNALNQALARKADAEAGFIASGKDVRDVQKRLGEQDFERGKFSAEQYKAIERLMQGMGKGTLPDFGRAIIQILMSGSYSARRGISLN